MKKNRVKILLVEDEPILAQLVSLFLQKSGYRVVHVDDGSKVIETVKKEMPDLIILDVMIPKLNGFEVCQKLKKDKKLKLIPVLILSALVQRGEIEAGIRMGADLYMTKPFQNSELLENIQELLRDRKA
jgi:DNA-binding response OmpR family regulator